MMLEDDTPTITLTIMVGSGGGFVVYDVSNSTSKLAFGGNLDETTAYLHAVMDSMRASPAETTVPRVAASPAAFRKLNAPTRLADRLADRLAEVDHA